jgi:hypothetical protein
MNKFTGTIIEESLENKEVLEEVKIISTRVSQVTEEHKTPWIKQWTLHKVEIEPEQAQDIAKELSKSLDPNHLHSWYADYKNENTHYVIYRDKIFQIDRTKVKEYKAAREYGLALGIPSYQIDFEKNVKKFDA